MFNSIKIPYNSLETIKEQKTYKLKKLSAKNKNGKINAKWEETNLQKLNNFNNRKSL